MRDIDLIPSDYRERQQQLRFLLRTVSVTGLAVVAVLMSYGVLRAETADLTEQAATLRAQNALTQRQQQELQELVDRRNEYLRQLSVLQGLRAGAAVNDIFAIVDDAIVPGKVWFTEWNFRRAGIVVDGEMRNIETGYFIIIDDDGRSAAKDDLEVETHMSIRGQAIDHRALSTFVRNLYAQSFVRDVNVRKTSQSDYSGGQIVNFDVTVILTSQARS